MIAGVQRGLDLSPPPDFEAIRVALKKVCHADDLGFNTEAASVLFDFLRSDLLDAYDDHPRNPLYIGPSRRITMGVEHYVIDGDRGVFRWSIPDESV